MGNALKSERDNPASGSGFQQLLLWGAASAICTHAVNLLGVVYWDQFYVIWYLHLALAVSLIQKYVYKKQIMPSKSLLMDAFS